MNKTSQTVQATTNLKANATRAKASRQQGRDDKAVVNNVATKATAQSSGGRQQLGKKGEDLACQLLERSGAKILTRNWKCQAGEADIIACEGGDLVFIEVKTRRSIAAGFPEEAVTAQKRARYEKIALHYLCDHDMPTSRVRFDVIAVTLISDTKTLIKHHRDAFCAGA